MDTKTKIALPGVRTRRQHSEEFKAQVIAASLKPGVSQSAVAQANGLNANLLRKWVKAHREGRLRRPKAMSVVAAPGTVPTLVPVTVQTTGDIRIEIRRKQTLVQIAWPTSQAPACAHWLRDLLK